MDMYKDTAARVSTNKYGTYKNGKIGPKKFVYKYHNMLLSRKEICEITGLAESSIIARLKRHSVEVTIEMYKRPATTSKLIYDNEARKLVIINPTINIYGDRITLHDMAEHSRKSLYYVSQLLAKKGEYKLVKWYKRRLAEIFSASHKEIGRSWRRS